MTVLVLSAGVVGGRTAGTLPYDTTYAGASTPFALLQVLAGAALVAAAILLLAERSHAAGALTVLLAVTWFAPVWAGWEGGPEITRAVAVVVAPLAAVAVLALAALLPPRPRPAARTVLLALVGVAALATAAASVGVALVREPLRDLYCWNDCTVDAFIVRDDPELARRLTSLVLALALGAAVAAVLVGVVRLAAASPLTRRASGPALAAVAVTAAAFAAYAAVLLSAPRESPDRPLYGALFVGRAAALVVLGAALAWLAVRPRLVRARVTRLAVALGQVPGEAGLGRLLGQAVGDAELRVVYPIGPGERVVDADGAPVALNGGRRVTPIVGDAGVVALVQSDATGADSLERALGPAARLALGNERLRAEAVVRLADATASRARVIASADAARRRMERDLHDAAQQRMLALGYDLRIALEIAESSADAGAAAALRAALARALAASEELREIAHGLFPVELAAAGLEAALESLADLRPLRLAGGLGGRRLRPETETAAYAVVVEALDAAGDRPVTVALAERDAALHLSVDGVTEWGERVVHIEDRVAAAGGTIAVEGDRLELVLP